LVRQSKEKQREEATPNPSRPVASTEEWHRKTAYEFTGCIAHIEVTEHSETSAVSRIMGIIEHNPACALAELKRRPPISLHDHVYEIAIEQLHAGAR